MYMYPLKKPACLKKLRLKKAQALLLQTFMKSLSFLHHVEKLELNVVSLTSILLRTITSAFLNTKKIGCPVLALFGTMWHHEALYGAKPDFRF